MRRVWLVLGWMVVALAAPVMGQGPVRGARQLLVVTTPGWDAVEGTLQRYERGSQVEPWRRVGAPVAIVVGKTGLAWGIGVPVAAVDGLRMAGDPVKKEGDGRSPAGVFRLGTAFGVAEQPLEGLKLGYVPLTPTVECVDDGASHSYNRLVDRGKVAVDWTSSEKMRETQPYYQWGLVIEHNWERPQVGGGSCIFLHVWGKPGEGTVGCTAMAEPELETVLRWIDPARRPLLVQLPVGEYERVRGRLGLR